MIISKTKIKQVGLLRIEGIIAEFGKHPNYFLEQNKIKDYEDLIFKGVDKIAQYFEEVWVRTSDVRSDEFQNLEGAPNEKAGMTESPSPVIAVVLRNLRLLAFAESF